MNNFEVLKNTRSTESRPSSLREKNVKPENYPYADGQTPYDRLGGKDYPSQARLVHISCFANTSLEGEELRFEECSRCLVSLQKAMGCVLQRLTIG